MWVCVFKRKVQGLYFNNNNDNDDDNNDNDVVQL